MVVKATGGGAHDPSGWLFEPVPEDAIPDEWEAILNVRSKVPSLGAMAMTAWEKAGGDDIPAAWSEMLAGDWRDVSRVSAALRNLGEFCEDYAQSLDAGVSLATSGWTGTAADAASTYFAGVSVQLRELKGTLDQVADDCNEVAFGVYECGVSVEDGVGVVFDLVLTAAVALAAAAASSWTGAGGLIGLGAAAAAIAAAVAKVKLIVGAIDLAFQVANGTIGVLATLCGAIAESVEVTLPGDFDTRATR